MEGFFSPSQLFVSDFSLFVDPELQFSLPYMWQASYRAVPCANFRRLFKAGGDHSAWKTKVRHIWGSRMRITHSLMRGFIVFRISNCVFLKLKCCSVLRGVEQDVQRYSAHPELHTRTPVRWRQCGWHAKAQGARWVSVAKIWHRCAPLVGASKSSRKKVQAGELHSAVTPKYHGPGLWMIQTYLWTS